MRLLLILMMISPLAHAADCTVRSIGEIPLNNLSQRLYLNRFPGGLYPNGSNQPPTDHDAAGRAFSGEVRPLDAAGRPDANGKIVLLSIGMSNTAQEFQHFVQVANQDPNVNHDHLVVVNGAQGGADADDWRSPNLPTYEDVRRSALARANVTEAQVQAVWLKVANGQPSVSLPNSNADAFQLAAAIGDIARALRVRYPNLQTVFLASRTYAGYATSDLNPEPYAYESGFAVKWAIEAQITQHLGQGRDPVVGDLRYPAAAPWLAWGPYLWADGERPRSDGLQWFCSDFQSDGTHPSSSGATMVAEMLLDFFLTSPYTAPWFADGGCASCGNAAITVQRPNGGEIFRPGTVETIRWSSAGDVGPTVHITVSLGSNSFTIASEAPNDGAFAWAVPSNAPDRNDYLVTIASNLDPNVTDTSDNFFSITSDQQASSITLISPNGGETLDNDTTHRIRWQTAGDTGSEVRLELTRDGRSVAIANRTPNDGEFAWNIPSNVPPNDGYTIVITSNAQPELRDESDSTFAIAD